MPQARGPGEVADLFPAPPEARRGASVFPELPWRVARRQPWNLQNRAEVRPTRGGRSLAIGGGRMRGMSHCQKAMAASTQTEFST